MDTQCTINTFYDSETKKYTSTISFYDHTVDIDEYLKGVGVRYSEIDLLENESIIIPLK
jgi:hypothetical protein